MTFRARGTRCPLPAILAWLLVIAQCISAPASAQGAPGAVAPVPLTNECATPRPGWIWCDDFEQDRLGKYFEYDAAGGRFVRAAGVGVGGSFGMRARWNAVGEVEAGALHLAMGKTPQA